MHAFVMAVFVAAILILILASYAECSPIRRYSSSAAQHLPGNNNVVIHAQIGEYVNISCWFDPKLVVRANYELDDTVSAGDENDFGGRRRKRRNVNHRHRRQHSRHHRSRDTGWKRPEPFLANSRVVDEQHETSAMPVDEESPEIKSYNVESSLSPSNGKYEVDWFFLDKHGRMNIISYGNKTRSNLKYKTFVNVGKPAASYDAPHMSYSSSALYSQSSSYLPAPSSSSSARSVPSATKSYTHYLNAFIESEDDEGVYQCINPDWPNFIIRNITVLIGRNQASRTYSGLGAAVVSLLLALWLTRS